MTRINTFLATALRSEAPESRREWAKELAIATVFFFLLASIVTWPLVWRMSSGIYGFGNDNFGGVWNTHYLHDAFWGPEKLGYSMEAGYPWGSSLPLEAIQPIDWIYTIIFGGISSGLFAYNLQVFVGFVASGTAAYFAARYVGASRYAALVLGGLFEIVPIHLALGMQYQALSSLQFLPLVVVAFIAAARNPGIRAGIWLGLAMGLVWWGSYYYGWFGIFVLGASFAVLLLGSVVQRNWELLRAQGKAVLGAVIGGGAMIVVPAALVLIRISDDPLTKERVLGDPIYVLAPPWSTILPPHDNPLLGTLTRDWLRGHGGMLPLYEQANYTGIVAALAALAGLIYLLRKSSADRILALALLAGVATAFVLMLGATIPLRFWSVDAWLAGRNVPHIKSLAGYLFELTPTFRYYGRAWAWGLAVIFVLGAFGAGVLQRRLHHRPALLFTIISLLGLFGVAEYINRPDTHWVGTEEDRTAWVKAVERLPKDAVVVNYPVAGYSTPRSLYYQFWSSFHERTTVEPYLFDRGGKLYDQIDDANDVGGGERLHQIGVDYAVVHTRLPAPTFPPYQPAWPDDSVSETTGQDNPWFKLVGSGEGYKLYKVLDKPRENVPASASVGTPFYPAEMEGERPAYWAQSQNLSLAVSVSPGRGAELVVPVRTPEGRWPVELCIKGTERCVKRTVGPSDYTDLRLKLPKAMRLDIELNTGAPVLRLGSLTNTPDDRNATIRVAQPTVEVPKKK